jgi:hypothetical protein
MKLVSRASKSLAPFTLGKGLAAALVLLWGMPAAPVRAQHQTDTLSSLQPVGLLPYRLTLRPVEFAAPLPTLHSFASGRYEGQWVLIAGRTNGMHGFESSGRINFPEASQNREVWVIDPVTQQSWSRSLDDASSGLDESTITTLTPANNQFSQIGDTLYMTGGYGVLPSGRLGTHDVLSAIDLPGMVQWVKQGFGTAAEHIRQLSDPLFRVTGGAMLPLQGRMHLIVGQDFQGGYTPTRVGTYTQQIRSFDLLDDGQFLAIANPTSTLPDEALRRRDLNVFPIIEPDGVGGIREAAVALSGVFTPADGAWTVPVEIAADGTPSMADPQQEATLRQGFNGYHSAKLGLYWESMSEMHEILFGGISLQTLDPQTQGVQTDHDLPFVNDITAVVRDAQGNFRQHHLGYFPQLHDLEGNLLRFGANAEFFPRETQPGAAPATWEAYDNGVLRLESLPIGVPSTLGFVYGGLVANAAHTRGNPASLSAASNRVFEVVLTRIPEPGTAWLVAIASLQRLRRRRFGGFS